MKFRNQVITIFPGMENEISRPRNGNVVVDEHIVTSKGPGTSMEFSLKIVELLCGKSVSERVGRNLLFKSGDM